MKIREFRRGDLVDWSQEARDLQSLEPSAFPIGPFTVHKIEHVRTCDDLGEPLREFVSHSQWLTVRKGRHALTYSPNPEPAVFSGVLFRLVRRAT